MQEIELCADYCPEDCVYRSVLKSDLIPCCMYAALAGESRKCKISECDKYRKGKPLKARIKEEYILYWEREFYDEDADVVWGGLV